MMKLKACARLVGLVASVPVSLAVATGAHAFPVAIHLTGTVATVDDTASAFGGVFIVGMPFAATIEYDTSIPDIDPSSTVGRYEENPASLMSISMSLGGVDITTSTVTSDASVLVRTDTNLLLPNVNGPLSTGPAISQIQMLLDSSNPLAITSDALPTTLDLNDFDGNRQMAFLGGSLVTGLAFVFADIQTLTVIPEPGTGVLLGLGVPLASAQRRRSTAAAQRRDVRALSSPGSRESVGLTIDTRSRKRPDSSG